jgi:hypothetical protein
MKNVNRGVKRCVFWDVTYVSEEYIASIFRIEEYAKKKPA